MALVAPKAGKLTFWIPDCASVAVAAMSKAPDLVAWPLTHTVPLPSMNVLPLAFDGVTAETVGAVVSTFTSTPDV